MRELTQTTADLTVAYRSLTDEERNSPFGQALADSIAKMTKPFLSYGANTAASPLYSNLSPGGIITTFALSKLQTSNPSSVSARLIALALPSFPATKKRYIIIPFPYHIMLKQDQVFVKLKTETAF
jgi:hypothetical protein